MIQLEVSPRDAMIDDTVIALRRARSQKWIELSEQERWQVLYKAPGVVGAVPYDYNRIYGSPDMRLRVLRSPDMAIIPLTDVQCGDYVVSVLGPHDWIGVRCTIHTIDRYAYDDHILRDKHGVPRLYVRPGHQDIVQVLRRARAYANMARAKALQTYLGDRL